MVVVVGYVVVSMLMVMVDDSLVRTRVMRVMMMRMRMREVMLVRPLSLLSKMVVVVDKSVVVAVVVHDHVGNEVNDCERWCDEVMVNYGNCCCCYCCLGCGMDERCDDGDGDDGGASGSESCFDEGFVVVAVEGMVVVVVVGGDVVVEPAVSDDGGLLAPVEAVVEKLVVAVAVAPFACR